MTFAAFDANNKIQENWTVYSIGGGALAETTAIRQLKVLKYMG